MKAIIERNLPLDTTYSLTDKKYVPLLDGCGTCCDNCGKLIARIATVRSAQGKSYSIGFDCLETILINNSLLSTLDVVQYEAAKKMLPKILRFSKQLQETIDLNNGLDGFRFERPTGYFKDDGWITYYLLKGNSRPYNTNVKIKGMDFDFLVETLRNIFPKHKIEVLKSI